VADVVIENPILNSPLPAADLEGLRQARTVVTNYHAFQLR
jgi:hypothetical protein